MYIRFSHSKARSKNATTAPHFFTASGSGSVTEGGSRSGHRSGQPGGRVLAEQQENERALQLFPGRPWVMGVIAGRGQLRAHRGDIPRQAGPRSRQAGAGNR